MGERRAVLGVWCVPGVGPKTLARLQAHFGQLSALLDVPVSKWLGEVELPQTVREALLKVSHIGDHSDAVTRKAQRGGMQITFKGDAEYPPRLAQIEDAPPVLFRVGPGPMRPQRSVAMVGTRTPESDFIPVAERFAERVAAQGLLIVSGGAVGIDEVCHRAAIKVGQVTWAFLGTALDEVDARQQWLMPQAREGRATVYSEFPPGVRGDRPNFPRRNRLISGAADAVLVLRAPLDSGALYTARYGLKQGRPVLAMPGDLHRTGADGVNDLLAKGEAKICTQPEHVLDAVGLEGVPLMPLHAPPVPDDLSAIAREVLEQVEKSAIDFDTLAEKLPKLDSGRLSSALVELQLAGLVMQWPGRRFQKI